LVQHFIARKKLTPLKGNSVLFAANVFTSVLLKTGIRSQLLNLRPLLYLRRLGYEDETVLGKIPGLGSGKF